jgi:hypothetical protein
MNSKKLGKGRFTNTASSITDGVLFPPQDTKLMCNAEIIFVLFCFRGTNITPVLPYK